MDSNSRRMFLKHTATITLLSFLYAPFKKCFASNTIKEKIPSWQELVEYARWCPTVHNLQPHQLKIISETEAELYYDPTRLLPVEDPNAIFVTIAMGIFHEHLSIAASPYMHKIEMTEVTESISISKTGSTLFAKLKLTATNDKEELDRELILKRKTSRLHYDGIALKEETANKIKTGASKFEHEFSYSSNKKLVDLLIDLNQKTLFEDISVKATATELDHLFRYSKEEAALKKDGLWSTCMCFPGNLMRSVFHHPKRWNHGLKKVLLKNYYRNSFKGTSTVCWFGGKFDNTEDWLNAGRMLARSWLTLTQENAFIHPFGSLITNKKAYEAINAACTQPTGNKKIWMIFRAGYSKEPARSLRLNTNEIIIH